jgi:hypothetical protein
MQTISNMWSRDEQFFLKKTETGNSLGSVKKNIQTLELKQSSSYTNYTNTYPCMAIAS